MTTASLRRLALIVALAAGLGSVTAGCGSSKQGAAPSGVTAFELQVNPGEPPVKVTAVIPADWKPRFDARRPDWKVAALDGKGLVSIAALGWSSEPAEWMAKSIAMQYDAAALAKAKREELSGGRVWIQAPEANGRIHARLFIPFDRGVVMGVAMIEDPDGTQLPAIRAVWESIQIVAPAP